MLQYPTIDPVIFSIGPLSVRWYGMMYLLGFIAAYLLGRRRASQPWSPLQPEQVEDLIFYGAIGAVLGGRFGYVMFYGFDRFLADPLWLLRVWEGGMAFHGGLLGVFVGLIIYARKLNQPLGEICDFVAPLAPIGLGLGRLANFINAELYGRVTDVPWAMIFPTDESQLLRHPSQLYQCFFEGFVLLLLVYGFTRVRRPRWAATGLFLLGYGVARYSVEFFREPDASLTFDWMTRGQFLSLPMIIGGLAMLAFAYYRFAQQGRQFPAQSAATSVGLNSSSENRPAANGQKKSSNSRSRKKMNRKSTGSKSINPKSTNKKKR